MIMAKFQALDRIQARSHSGAVEEVAADVGTVGMQLLAAVEERSRDGCLTDAQLLEVFEQVSRAHMGAGLMRRNKERSAQEIPKPAWDEEQVQRALPVFPPLQRHLLSSRHRHPCSM